MKFFSKKVAEDISIVALYDENKQNCQNENGGCQDYGCGNTVNVGVTGGCM